MDRKQLLQRHVNKRPQLTIPLVHCNQTKIFELLLLDEYDDTQVLTVAPFLHEQGTKRSYTYRFFFKICNYLPNVFQCFVLKNLYCAIMFGFYRSSHICDHLSENPHSSHKHVHWKKKKEFKNYLWNYACYRKIYLQRLIGPAISKGSFKSTKLYILSYSPGYGELENLCFVSIAWTVSVSRVFVYNAVDIKTAFLAKPPP